MRGKIGLIVLVLCVTFQSAIRADQVMEAAPYIAVAEGGRFYFKMVPDKKREGTGTGYEVTSAGRDRRLWSVSGWFSFAVFLSEDGRYLVRLGDWPQGHKPSDEHLAVAFYDKGELLAQYSTKALIKNPGALRPSTDHYEYLMRRSPRGFIGTAAEPYGIRHWFQLVTYDGIHYVFDRRTGEIVSEAPYDK
jgi:hypothetical protein